MKKLLLLCSIALCLSAESFGQQFTFTTLYDFEGSDSDAWFGNGALPYGVTTQSTSGVTSGTNALEFLIEDGDSFFGAGVNITNQGDRDLLKSAITNNGSLLFDFSTIDGSFPGTQTFADFNLFLNYQASDGAGNPEGPEYQLHTNGHFGMSGTGADLTTTFELPLSQLGDINAANYNNSTFYQIRTNFGIDQGVGNSSRIYLDNVRLKTPIPEFFLKDSFESGLNNWESNANVPSPFTLSLGPTGATDGVQALQVQVSDANGDFGMARIGVDVAAFKQTLAADGFVLMDITTTSDSFNLDSITNPSEVFAQLNFVVNSGGFRSPEGPEFIFGDAGADIIANPGTATAAIPLSIFDNDPLAPLADQFFYQFFVGINSNATDLSGMPINFSIDNVRLVADFDSGLDGDFDSDGDVDGEDFLKWQRDGLPATDLADWQANYGTGTQPNGVSSVSAVPEPGSLLLAISAGFVATVAQRRCRRPAR